MTDQKTGPIHFPILKGRPMVKADRKELTLAIVGMAVVSIGSGLLFFACFLFPGFDIPLAQLTWVLFFRYIGAAVSALGGIFLMTVGINTWEGD